MIDRMWDAFRRTFVNESMLEMWIWRFIVSEHTQRVEEMVFIVQYKYKKDKRVLIVNSADGTSQFDETMFCTNLFSFFPEYQFKVHTFTALTFLLCVTLNIFYDCIYKDVYSSCTISLICITSNAKQIRPQRSYTIIMYLSFASGHISF